MSSPIRDFYIGRSIFITGATGFIGKALIEKFLRSCDGIERIYILLRDKKGRSVQQRWNDYISDKIFELSGIKMSEKSHKIIPISGDLSLPGLGISDEDRQQLIDNVSVVLHVAGYVKFDPPLREAIKYNLMGTISVVQLCRQIKRLEVLVYVSTLTVLMNNTNENEEMVYSTPVSPEHVIETCEKCDDKQLEKYVKLFFPKFPNTYTISKALAEQIIVRENENFNIAIVRPSATNPAYREPVPGWVLGIHGPSAVALLGTLGIMRIAQFDYRVRPPQIPVDFVCNAVIAAAFYNSNQKKPNQLQVYHLTTQSDNTPTLYEITKMLINNALNAPSKRLVRPPRTSFFKSKFVVQFEGIFKHWAYAYIFDFVAKLMGIKAGLVKMTGIMTENVKVVTFFTKAGPDYEINNTRQLIDRMSSIDRREFDFDVRGIDWQPYYKNIWMGMRRYLLNENDEEIPKARRRLE